MGHGLSWTQDRKRVRCSKCDKFQLVVWSKLCYKTAKCKECGTTLTTKDIQKIKKPKEKIRCSICANDAKYVDKHNEMVFSCDDCINKLDVEWIPMED
jgi:hypothetical protein